jgi:pentatricopeptide repeat protein
MPLSFTYRLKYATTLAACNRDGAWRAGLRLFHEMSTEGVDPSPACFAAALDCCAAGALPDEALRILARMREARSAALDVEAYTAAIRSCIPGGKYVT